LPLMLRYVKAGKISIEKVVEKMSHAPAECFRIQERGYIREGYYADLVLIDPDKDFTANKNNILYKCGWSPFEGDTFSASITHTFVNGHLVYENGVINDGQTGRRLQFSADR